jgi:hypothetical protein
MLSSGLLYARVFSLIGAESPTIRDGLIYKYNTINNLNIFNRPLDDHQSNGAPVAQSHPEQLDPARYCWREVPIEQRWSQPDQALLAASGAVL